MKDNDQSSGLSHVGASGEAKMVDVTPKGVTDRVARARGSIRMQPATLEAIRSNTLKKGDVLAVARVAGILAGKRTSDLIPLCHPIPLTDLQLDLRPDDSLPGIMAEASARATWTSGVEMVVLTAVTVAVLTV